MAPVAAASFRPAEPGAPALTVWHGGWAAAVGLTALAAWLIGLPINGPVAVGVLVMAVPGLAGMVLAWRDEPRMREGLLGVWTLSALGAAILTGGVGGALPGFLFMPLVAGLALGGRRCAGLGASGVAIAIVGGLASLLIGSPAANPPLLAAASGLLAVAAAAVALSLTLGRREQALGQAEEAVARVEGLLAGQPGLTLVLEASGRVVAAYGAPPPALPVDPLFADGLISSVHAPDRPGVLSALNKALAGQEAQATFLPRRALDRRVTLIVRRQPGTEGHETRLIAQAFDGTLQFARELELEAARVEAEAQSEGKTRFLANMSHELRTPLNAVLGFSDIMRQRLFGPLPEKYLEYASSIHEAGGHLLDLINDVLDVSKIAAERYELTLERFDAREVVSAAIALVRLQANDKDIDLHGVLPNDPLPVDADRRAVKQIVLNLLSNAIKFTPADGAVTVTMEAVGPYLEIVVADTGVGIAPEDLRRLGRPFEQAGAADQRAQGTGLGLSLVRSLAELHGGRMTIDSTLGEGAAVTVRMPVVVAERAPLPEGGAEIIPLNIGG